jgi:hypothetical protein
VVGAAGGEGERLGVEAVFEGVAAGAGAAPGMARSGGLQGCAGINRHEAGDERALQERR